MSDASGTPLADATQDSSLEKAPFSALVQLLITGSSREEVLEEIHRRTGREVSTSDLLSEQNTLDIARNVIAGLSAGDHTIGSFFEQASKDLDEVARQVSEALATKTLVCNADGESSANKATTVADPVDPSTGQLIYTHVDLRFDGGGIDFELVRTHRSGAHNPGGNFSDGWDHNLNLYARRLASNSYVVNSGGFRQDRFDRVSTGNTHVDYFAPPDGYHATLVETAASSSRTTLVLTRPDGMTYYYQADAANPDVHRVTRIIDRFGNQLVLGYNTSTGLLQHVSVNDPADRDSSILPSRTISLQYDDLDRIITISDKTDRRVEYTYDDYGDLVAVKLPATAGYPLGRTTYYSYSSATGPVAHQLMSVVDEDGRRYLDVEYGIDEGFASFARVVRQRDDEGEWLFEYAELDHIDPPTLTTATRFTAMTRPSGHRVEMELNTSGNVLVRRESAFDEDGVPQPLVIRSWFNADGELVAKRVPLREAGDTPGLMIEQRFGREDYEAINVNPPTAEQRRAFGNRTRLIRRNGPQAAPLGTPLRLPNDITHTFEYDSPYQLLKRETDPRDESLVTTYRYDPIATLAGPVPRAAALTAIEHPATTDPDGATAAAGRESFAYDTQGRRTLAVDCEGHRTVSRYFGPRDREPVHNVTLDGYCRSITIGDSDANAATTTYIVNARGAPIQITDPRGSMTVIELDDRDAPLAITRTLAPGVSFTTKYRYNAEGKVRERVRPIADDTGKAAPEPFEVRFYGYGDTGQLLRDSIGSRDPQTWLTTRYVYDDEGRLTRAITPRGAVTHFRCDAQKRVIATTRGCGTPDASTSRIRYDLGGRKRATVDPRGNVTTYDYDGFGRIARVVNVVDVADPVADTRPLARREGHTRIFTRDALGNVTLERVFEWTAPGTYHLLTRTSTVYDQRSRPIRIVRTLFSDPIPATLDAFADAPPPSSSPIETWQFYDRDGRLRERREGVTAASAGSSTIFTYDAAGRPLTATTRLLELAAATVVRVVTTYDANGNAIRVDRIDHELDATGTVVGKEAITQVAEFDALGRRTTDIDGLGNRTTYRYDSRDAMIERRDARGAATIRDYDVYGRLARRVERPTTSERILIRYGYDDDGNVVSLDRVDGVGRTWSIANAFDALQRRIRTTVAPGTPLARSYETRYDPGSNVLSHTRATGLRDTRTWDPLNRCTRIDYDFATARDRPVAGTSFEAWRYDCLGHMVHAETDQTSVDIRFDSLGRPIDEVQTLSGWTLALQREHVVLGHRTLLRYPSGRSVRATWDSAGRLLTITDAGGSTVGTPAARPRTILERSSIGHDPRRERYANGVGVAWTRDAVGRRIRFGWWDASGAKQLAITQLFDEAGNRAQEWLDGNRALAASFIYGYDGVNWLTAVGRSSAPIPTFTANAPPAPPAAPDTPSGQSVVASLIGTADLGTLITYAYDAGGNRKDYDVDGLDRDMLRGYDADGNTLDSGDTRQFDAYDRLIVGEGGLRAVYDALGRRVLVDDGTVRRRLIYDGHSELASYVSATLESESVLGSDVDERIELAIANHTYVLHRDQVGSTRMVTDERGTTVARIDFDPYGLELASSAPWLRHRFMGRELDATLGLYHFGARHYDPAVGRFQQRDPAESQPERSSYQAFAGNPLRYIDPMGTNPGDRHEGEKPFEQQQPEFKLEGLSLSHEDIQAIHHIALGGDVLHLALEVYLIVRHDPRMAVRAFVDLHKGEQLLEPGVAGATARLGAWLGVINVGLGAYQVFEGFQTARTSHWTRGGSDIVQGSLIGSSGVATVAGLGGSTLATAAAPILSAAAVGFGLGRLLEDHLNLSDYVERDAHNVLIVGRNALDDAHIALFAAARHGETEAREERERARMYEQATYRWLHERQEAYEQYTRERDYEIAAARRLGLPVDEAALNVASLPTLDVKLRAIDARWGPILKSYR